MDTSILVEALAKFKSWSAELESIESEVNTDAADELLRALYSDPDQMTYKLIGGSNAPILMDAAKSIHAKGKTKYALNVAEEKLLDAEHLHDRNHGGHWYPGLGHGTSDCRYCKCSMGSFRSFAPEGMDAHGDCHGNPKLRDAYALLKEKSDPVQ